MTTSIDFRLDHLPRKVATPFRRLLAAGQLTEDVIGTVLDAGEIAGDTQRLIGFTAGYLHLRAQGVPVHDVIRMARQHGRRINLSWSPARWKDEHDRLSRVESLRKMAGDNIAYDVAPHEIHLPKRFSGYLIRNSRRLGMEGFRQRHCVASYHDTLTAGGCAIAAVFVDKQRWTVALMLTGRTDDPLCITQIKSRFNGFPSAAVRHKIHTELGIRVSTPTPDAPAIVPARFLYMENLRLLLPLLRQLDVETVVVSFDGCGDSGAIQEINYDKGSELTETINEHTVEQRTISNVLDDGRWISTVALETKSLEQAIEALTYDYLEETDVNWYDNDGGFGQLRINVAEGTVVMEVNVRLTECDLAYSAERDIETGEDL